MLFELDLCRKGDEEITCGPKDFKSTGPRHGPKVHVPCIPGPEPGTST